MQRTSRETPHRLQQRSEVARDPDGTTADRIRPARRCDTAKDRTRNHAVREPSGTREDVRTATREADAREALDTELIGDDFDVVCPLGEVAVQVHSRLTDSRSFEHDQTNAEILRDQSRLGCDLPTSSRRPVEPKDRNPINAAVFGESDLALT
jgi:hypothetical protein